MAAKTAVAVKKQPRELTEEEILKAPEKDYMNEAQLAFFRKRLEDIRDQILRNADDTGEHLRENEITTDPPIVRRSRRNTRSNWHARPGTQAAEEGRKIAADDRGRVVWLLRGNR